ncbi:uncharacterized protein LOC108291356 [Cebus imitator]|uniref:uncharacterized protein LOC108291356 n=1 Tax=Cebus imitator TaxID=2715852 RepID=UPI000809C3DD|nr:uncharacterized protein LOC108291356 [Cebus imitator]
MKGARCGQRAVFTKREGGGAQPWWLSPRFSSVYTQGYLPAGTGKNAWVIALPGPPCTDSQVKTKHKQVTPTEKSSEEQLQGVTQEIFPRGNPEEFEFRSACGNETEAEHYWKKFTIKSRMKLFSQKRGLRQVVSSCFKTNAAEKYQKCNKLEKSLCLGTKPFVPLRDRPGERASGWRLGG